MDTTVHVNLVDDDDEKDPLALDSSIENSNSISNPPEIKEQQSIQKHQTTTVAATKPLPHTLRRHVPRIVVKTIPVEKKGSHMNESGNGANNCGNLMTVPRNATTTSPTGRGGSSRRLQQQQQAKAAAAAAAAGASVGGTIGGLTSIHASPSSSNAMSNPNITATPTTTIVTQASTMREVLASIPGLSVKPRRRSSKKISTAAQIEQTKDGKIDLETPDSILASTNLRALLNKQTFSMLPPFYQYNLIQLLPSVDREAVQIETENSNNDNDAPPRQSMIRLGSSSLNNEFFARACLEWRERLSEGEFTPENQMKLKTEAEREKNKLDPWKLKHFEPIWGEKSANRASSTSSNDSNSSLSTKLKKELLTWSSSSTSSASVSTTTTSTSTTTTSCSVSTIPVATTATTPPTTSITKIAGTNLTKSTINHTNAAGDVKNRIVKSECTKNSSTNTSYNSSMNSIKGSSSTKNSTNISTSTSTKASSSILSTITSASTSSSSNTSTSSSTSTGTNSSKLADEKLEFKLESKGGLTATIIKTSKASPSLAMTIPTAMLSNKDEVDNFKSEKLVKLEKQAENICDKETDLKPDVHESTKCPKSTRASLDNALRLQNQSKIDSIAAALHNSLMNQQASTVNNEFSKRAIKRPSASPRRKRNDLHNNNENISKQMKIDHLRPCEENVPNTTTGTVTAAIPSTITTITISNNSNSSNNNNNNKLNSIRNINTTIPSPTATSSSTSASTLLSSSTCLVSTKHQHQQQTTTHLKNSSTPLSPANTNTNTKTKTNTTTNTSSPTSTTIPLSTNSTRSISLISNYNKNNNSTCDNYSTSSSLHQTIKNPASSTSLPTCSISTSTSSSSSSSTTTSNVISNSGLNEPQQDDIITSVIITSDDDDDDDDDEDEDDYDDDRDEDMEDNDINNTSDDVILTTADDDDEDDDDQDPDQDQDIDDPDILAQKFADAENYVLESREVISSDSSDCIIISP